jgi:hypothetical protein
VRPSDSDSVNGPWKETSACARPTSAMRAKASEKARLAGSSVLDSSASQSISRPSATASARSTRRASTCRALHAPTSLHSLNKTRPAKTEQPPRGADYRPLSPFGSSRDSCFGRKTAANINASRRYKENSHGSRTATLLVCASRGGLALLVCGLSPVVEAAKPPNYRMCQPDHVPCTTGVPESPFCEGCLGHDGPDSGRRRAYGYSPVAARSGRAGFIRSTSNRPAEGR